MPSVSANTTTRPASSFPLNRVRLLEGDFKTAQDTSLRYVLELDADRLCAPYLLEAGLESPAEPYGNWESDGMGGHIGGHYLSACAQLYAATGDRRLLDRLEHVVEVFGRCQAAGRDGYVGGVPGGRALGLELAAGDGGRGPVHTPTDGGFRCTTCTKRSPGSWMHTRTRPPRPP